MLTIAVLAFAGLNAPLHAQGAAATPCVLDHCDDTAASPAPAAGSIAPARRGTAPAGNFDFFILALSWSPGFCSTGGDSRSPDQCAIGGKLGFVVHGLWPQYEHGRPPSNCDSGGAFVTRAQIAAVHDLYPDDGLARHEWRVHGTCSGKSPTDYFADVRLARQAIVIPDAFVAPAQQQSVDTTDVARGFIAANPGLRLNAMAVTCRSGTLEEVRICFSKDLRQFQTCPEVSRASCRARQINVPPVH